MAIRPTEEGVRMGKNAHERFVTHYSQRQFITSMHDVLKDAMKDVA